MVKPPASTAQYARGNGVGVFFGGTGVLVGVGVRVGVGVIVGVEVGGPGVGVSVGTAVTPGGGGVFRLPNGMA